MTPRQKEALQCVYESGFVLNELNLYLDTHRACADGLARWQQARQEYLAAKQRYECEFGPLTVCETGAAPGCGWNWITAPWPWELED